MSDEILINVTPQETRVAVTGAGGFIGNAICRGLGAEGADVNLRADGLDVDADVQAV